MLDQNLFKKKLLDMNFNFNLKYSDDDITKYAKFMYPFIQDKFNDDEIVYGFNQLFSLKSEEYNKKYGYGGRPAVADLADLFTRRRKKVVELEKDKNLRIAIENAKNGISTRKAIENHNSVKVEDIKEIINKIGSYED